MINKKKIYYILMVLILSISLLVACTNNSANDTSNSTADSITTNDELNISTISDENLIVITRDMISYDDNDTNIDWEDKNPSYITLNGSTATTEGSGTTINESDITITKAGVYVISGKLNDGQIIIDVDDDEIVQLVLNEMEIYSSDSAPIYVMNAGKTIITLEQETKNYVSDSENYTFPDSETDEPNATIFSKDDLTINGTGTLSVDANYNNGITSKDDLKIMSGNINIYSEDDGIMGRNMVAVKVANITIESGGDGIKSTNDEDIDKGFVVIEGGTFDISSESDAIHAITSMLITDGKFAISTGNGSITQSSSAKGLKATSNIAIDGGTFVIESSDDAIHSNNSIIISDCDMTIRSGDDGIHSDSSIDINSGTISITKSYEGIESEIITISGGDIDIVASDDGINVAGGNDSSSMNGRPGENSFSSSGNSKLTINGGDIFVNARGDGLDANGSIYMTNGTILVTGPTDNGNGSIDYDGTFEISGGLLVAAGSSGMTQAPSTDSKQYSIAMTYSSTQQAGSTIKLEDSDGNTIATFTPDKVFQSIIISSSDFTSAHTYSLYTGGTETVEFNISDIVTWLNESGVTTGSSTNQPGPQGKPGGDHR